MATAHSGQFGSLQANAHGISVQLHFILEVQTLLYLTDLPAVKACLDSVFLQLTRSWFYFDLLQGVMGNVIFGIVD